MRQHKRDYFYRKAKEKNYRSRASFKLIQASNQYGFINRNNVVLDLGAAPGGWLQIERIIVGEKGFILGVDLTEIKPLNYNNIITIVGDIRTSRTLKRIQFLLPRSADVVTSDLSPNVSGVWELDHALQIELAERSLNIATSFLRYKGSFFVKVFQGEHFTQFLGQMKDHFLTVKAIKPKASRPQSAEIYILGLQYKSNR